MNLILVKNPHIKKMDLEFFDSNSWSISPGFDGHNIVNNINYSKLNDYGEKFLSEDHIIGYDIDKLVYFSFKKNTVIEEYVIEQNNILQNNKIYDKFDYYYLISKIPNEILDRFNLFDYVILQ